MLICITKQMLTIPKKALCISFYWKRNTEVTNLAAKLRSPFSLSLFLPAVCLVYLTFRYCWKNFDFYEASKYGWGHNKNAWRDAYLNKYKMWTLNRIATYDQSLAPFSHLGILTLYWGISLVTVYTVRQSPRKLTFALPLQHQYTNFT